MVTTWGSGACIPYLCSVLGSCVSYAPLLEDGVQMLGGSLDPNLGLEHPLELSAALGKAFFGRVGGSATATLGLDNIKTKSKVRSLDGCHDQKNLWL